MWKVCVGGSSVGSPSEARVSALGSDKCPFSEARGEWTVPQVAVLAGTGVAAGPWAAGAPIVLPVLARHGEAAGLVRGSARGDAVGSWARRIRMEQAASVGQVA